MDHSAVGPHIFAIAGLPPAISGRVATHLNKLYAKSGTFRALSAAHTGPIYNSDYLNQLIRMIADFVSAQEVPPKTISVFYVNITNTERLVEQLYRFASLVPLNDYAEAAAWRFSEQEARDHVERAFVNRQPLAVPGRNAVHLLPAKNFQVTEDVQFGSVLKDFVSGQLENKDLVQRINTACYTSNDLPRVLRNGRKKTFAVDTRGLVFPPCAPTEAHGLKRYDRSGSPEVTMSYLVSAYRLGSFIGHGFHYDVQFARRTDIENAEFVCCEQGDLMATKSNAHANIYMNDFVRLSHK